MIFKNDFCVATLPAPFAREHGAFQLFHVEASEVTAELLHLPDHKVLQGLLCGLEHRLQHKQLVLQADKGLQLWQALGDKVGLVIAEDHPVVLLDHKGFQVGGVVHKKSKAVFALEHRNKKN